MTAALNLLGQKFSRLTVIGRATNSAKGQAHWICKCECGTVGVIAGTNLRSGATKSCGCLNKEAAAARCSARATHGMRGSPEYISWMAMRVRCGVVANEETSYSIRGISVCERWRHSFANFYVDMGPKPSPTHTIDRYPNNDGHYEPSNCRWATCVEQQNNKRSNRLVVYRGETMTLRNAVRAGGEIVRKDTARRRLILGWPVERAVETPPLAEYQAKALRRKRRAA